MNSDNTVQAMQTDSEYESDVSSRADSSIGTLSREHLLKRIESLMQENRVLKVEVDTFKLKLKAAQKEIKQLKYASVSIQARAEQEEEFISNTLLKKIQELKKEKETLANNYEREEEYLTNDLSRKLLQLRDEKQNLEQTLEQEQASQVNKLMKRIKRLEAETMTKQDTLEQLKREKIELENTLEKEQESLVNRLWKRMEKLETDKRLLQEKLEQPNTEVLSSNTKSNMNSVSSISATSDPSSPLSHSRDDALSTPPTEQTQSLVIQSPRTSIVNVDHITQLRREVEKLKNELLHTQDQHREKMEHYEREERDIRNENLKLQRKLQLEVERREQLCRQLSESESSLEMDEERQLNERIKVGGIGTSELTSSSSGTSSTNNSKQRSSTSSLSKVAIRYSSSFQQASTRERAVSSPSHSSGEQQLTESSSNLVNIGGDPMSFSQNPTNRFSVLTAIAGLTSAVTFQKPYTTRTTTSGQQRNTRTNVLQDHSMDESEHSDK